MQRSSTAGPDRLGRYELRFEIASGGKLADFAKRLLPRDLERRAELVAQAKRPGEAPAGPLPEELTHTKPTSGMLRGLDEPAHASHEPRRAALPALLLAALGVLLAAFG